MTDPQPAPAMLDDVDLAALAPGAAFEAVGVELEVTDVADVDGRAIVMCDVTLYGEDAHGADAHGEGAHGEDAHGADATDSDGPDNGDASSATDAGRCYAARLYVDGGAYYFAGLPAGAAEAVALLFRGAPRVVLL